MNKTLIFKPHSLITRLYTDSWADQLVFEEDENDNLWDDANWQFGISGQFGVANILCQSVFSSYFESVRAEIEAKYPGRGKSDTSQWPGVWNFGRVVRNAFSHGGVIDIWNSKSPTVSWRHLSYSSANNTRQIFNVDLTIVEIIYLMHDMDAAI